MRRTLARVARTLLLLAIGLELVWLLAANAALLTHVFPRLISRSTKAVALDYRHAWSLYPGELSVRGFHVRGKDRSGLRWSATAEQAQASVSLGALLHHTFRTTSLNARGVAFRFEGGEPEPDEQESGKRYWTVDLEGGAVRDVRQIDVLALRLQGHGEVHGRIRIVPHQRVELGPFQVRFQGAALRDGKALVASDVELRLGGGLRAYDPRVTHGKKLLGQLVASVDATAQVASLAPLELPLDASHGTLALHATLIDGVPQPDSSAAFKLPDARIIAGPVALSGPLDAHAEAKAGVISVSASLQPAQVKLRDLPHARLEGGLLAASVELDRDLQPSKLRLRARHLHTHELAAFSALLPQAIVLRGGSATVDARLADGRGELRLSTRDLKATLAGKPLSGQLAAHLHLRDVSPTSADLSGSHLRLQFGNGWWLNARVPEGHLALAPHLLAQGSLDARAPDAKPILDILAKAKAIPGLVAQAFELPDLRIHAMGRYAHRVLTLAPARAVGGHAGFEAALQIAQDVNGALLVRAGPANIGLALHGGELSLGSLAGQGWFNQRMKALVPAAAPQQRVARSPAARRPRR